jgi:hypothetical protein
VPLAVVHVIAHPDRGVREPDVITDEMKRVAPPRVPLHSDVVQNLLEVETNLDADQALFLDRRVGPVTLGAIGGRQEQPAQRADVDSQTLCEPGKLEIGRVDVVVVNSPGTWDVRSPKRSLVRVTAITLAIAAPVVSITRSSQENPCLVNPSLSSFAAPVATAMPKPHRIAAFSE